jgi:hypothetical protein
MFDLFIQKKAFNYMSAFHLPLENYILSVPNHQIDYVHIFLQFKIDTMVFLSSIAYHIILYFYCVLWFIYCNVISQRLIFSKLNIQHIFFRHIYYHFYNIL